MNDKKNPVAYAGTVTPNKDINKAASKAFGVTVNKIFSKTRKREIIETRHAVVYYRSKVLKQQPHEIKADTGVKHDTTWYINNKAVPNLLQYNQNFKKKYQQLVASLL